MSETQNDFDLLLDRAANQISSSEPGEGQAQAAADRVWSRLSADSADAAAQAAEVDEIRGCDDYQALIPAYLEGALPEARKLLLEDHTRECVPCRRALKLAREGEAAAPAAAWQEEQAASTFNWGSYKKWAIAAALIVGVGLAQFLVREMLPFRSGPSATVQTVDGDLFRVAATSHVPIAVGDAIAEGDTLRTGREGSAVVRLDDGSMVEVRQRSELRIEESHRGTTLELERGSVIVQAAPQRERHLYVSTEDCLVSVTGTIFSVNHGTKGSRVAVIEGEVKVAHSGEETVLVPGQQVATQVQLANVPIQREIAWSRDVDHYLSLLGEYAQLRQELKDSVTRPGQRHSTLLLDLAPENTLFYAGLPNLGDTVNEAHQLIQDRLRDSEVLAEWWNSEGAAHFGPEVDEIVSRLSEFGEYLGEELSVVGYTSGPSDFEAPLVLAEVVDPAGLRFFIEQQIADLTDGQGGLIFVEDPLSPPAAGQDEGLLWVSDGLAVATVDGQQITRIAQIVLENQPNPFTDTEFYSAIAELYEEGVEIVVAADLEGVMATSMVGESESDIKQVARLGMLDLRHLLLEQKQLGPKTHHRASLTFNEARKGVASWLAPPAPMGALDFISPDAQLVAAAVFKDPVKLIDDLYSMMDSADFGPLAELEQKQGFSLRDDVAGSFGGEFAIALDGPMLPVPSWKIVLEAYDPARLQWTIGEAVAEANTRMKQEGMPTLELLHEEVSGRDYYTLKAAKIEAHYTYVDGYIVLGANRTLLDRAIRFRESGYTLTDAAKFKSLMPSDGRNNFSGVIYQDLSGVMASVAERLAQGQLNEQQAQTLEAMQAESKPMMGYVYADEKSILLAASSENDLMSSMLLSTLGMKNPAGWQQLFQGM